MGDYLVHYGIKGQSWGKRRFQNLDGSLTPAGERRYNYEQGETGSERRHGGTSGSFNNSRYRYESRNKANAANARVFPQVNQQVRDNARANAQARASNYGTQSRFGSRNNQGIATARSQNRNAPGSESANSYVSNKPRTLSREEQARVWQAQAYNDARWGGSSEHVRAMLNVKDDQARGRTRTMGIREKEMRPYNNINKDQMDGYDRTNRIRVKEDIQRQNAIYFDQERGKDRTEQINAQRQQALAKGDANIQRSRNQAAQMRDQYRHERDSEGQNQTIAESRERRRLAAQASKLSFVKNISPAQYSKGEKLVAKLLSIFKRSGSR